MMGYRTIRCVIVIMKLVVSILILLCLCLAKVQTDQDAGTTRLNALLNRSSTSPSHIIQFTSKDFDEYAMKYPRPYDLVIYFHAKQIELSSQLFEEYNYTVQLYSSQGAISTSQNPTFFVKLDFSSQTEPLFSFFGFDSAPNLAVSKPEMAVLVGSQQLTSYIKQFSWRISHTDGVVTTRKMLQFINKRTGKDIIYKQTEETIKYVLSIFLAVSVVGVLVYKMLRVVWSHWFFWFIGSMVIYLVCMTGIVHCILNGDIWKEFNQKGKISFFNHGQQGGKHGQTFFEGLLVSGIVTVAGVTLIVVAVTGEKLRERYSAIIGVIGLVLVFYAINYIELVYSNKSWYGPKFQPPSHYLHGPLRMDQGNTI